MNIQLLSDLHLESHPHFSAQPLAGADVLVLDGPTEHLDVDNFKVIEDWP